MSVPMPRPVLRQPQAATANLLAMLGDRRAAVERRLGLTPTPAVPANGDPT